MKNSRNKIVQLFAYRKPDFMALIDFHQSSSNKEARKGTALWTVNEAFKDDKASMNAGARHRFVYDATHKQPINRKRRLCWFWLG